MQIQEPAANELPKPQAFTAVTALIAFVNFISILPYLTAPEGPQDLMAPSVRPVSIALGLLSASGLLAAWLRNSWGVYLFLGAMLAAELGILSSGAPMPILLIGPALVGLYAWSLHVGGAYSMRRQLFGGVGESTPGVAYGIQPTMPPRRPATAAAPPPVPTPPPVARTTTAAAPVQPGSAPPASAPSSDPLERLKRLAALRDARVITPQEFEAKKTELLKQL